MSVVTFDVEDNIGTLTLNRPEVHNAIDAATIEALEKILDEIDQLPDLRVLIVTGAGGSFCAGGDLSYFAGLERIEDARAMTRRMAAVLRRLADGPRPVIAAVGGNTYGGGCEVLLACHLRLAVPTARFSFRQAAMGVVTGWGGGVRLVRTVGRSNALRLLLTADVVEGIEARRLGLIDFLVEDPERLMDEALALARRISANASESIGAFLELVRCFEAEGPEAAEQREAELFEQGWVGEHFRQKVAEWTRDRGRD